MDEPAPTVTVEQVDGWAEWTAVRIPAASTPQTTAMLRVPGEGLAGDLGFAVIVDGGVQCGILTPRGTPAPSIRALEALARRHPDATCLDPASPSWARALGGVVLRGVDFAAVLDAVRATLSDGPDAAAPPGLVAATAAAGLRLRCLMARHADGGPAWVPELVDGLPPTFDPTTWRPGDPEPPELQTRHRPPLVDHGGPLPWTEPAWAWLQTQPFLVRRRIRLAAEARATAAGAEWVDLATARARTTP